MKRIRIFLLLGFGLLAVTLAIRGVFLITESPSYTLSGVETRALAMPGPFTVRKISLTLIDPSRATPRNGSFAGASERKLKTSAWYPVSPTEQAGHNIDDDDATLFPLVIYSHGFMSMRSEGTYLAEFLATHGYVVIAADFPLTNYFSPGGPTFIDLPNQPGDVRFLIDTALLWNQDPKHALYQRIDPQRIAVVGLSLGGLTSTLAAYHPTLRDPRIAAAVSIAGPASMFGSKFFASASVPILMLAGKIDAIVPYDANARVLLERAPLSTLITIDGATHIGFAGLADPFLRPLENADSFGCANVKKYLPRNSDFLKPLGGEENGMITAAPRLPCETSSLPPSIKPDQQQMLTKLAVLSFLESYFAQDPEEREKEARFIAEKFALENPLIHTEFPSSALH